MQWDSESPSSKDNWTSSIAYSSSALMCTARPKRVRFTSTIMDNGHSCWIFRQPHPGLRKLRKLLRDCIIGSECPIQACAGTGCRALSSITSVTIQLSTKTRSSSYKNTPSIFGRIHHHVSLWCVRLPSAVFDIETLLLAIFLGELRVTTHRILCRITSRHKCSTDTNVCWRGNVLKHF